MTMTPRVRKFALTAHVACSVGWLGAVASFLALAIAGLARQDTRMVGAAYLAMDMIGWSVIVPLSLASLVTGLVQSLGTQWGLFRHYWVLVKFVLTVGATTLLLLHMQLVSRISVAAAETTLSCTDLRGLRLAVTADAGLALMVLLINATLSVYKPQGVTRYGWRKQHEERHVSRPIPLSTRSPRRRRYVLLGIVGVVLLVVVLLHLTGGGLGPFLNGF